MNAEALIGMVLGTCTLQKLIGQGGMGAVYLAQQSRPRRQVAVKVLLPMTPLAPNQRAAFLERFRRETDAAASLEHPNIMPVHEYGERDGLAYLVMPYINGGTLRDELERSGPLPLAKAMNYLDQITAALDLAHERGVIHRDIKPANLLMTQDGRLVLSDFGLVKVLAEEQSGQSRLTGEGVPMGTPDYMAPEQVIGSEVDARADIYSLGCIVYHMVTGMVPFKGDLPMQVAMQHLSTPPQPPRAIRPDLPPAAEQVILRAMAKRPADRYMRAQDFASAFRLALTAAGVQLEDNFYGLVAAATEARVFTPRGLFDPARQARQRQVFDPMAAPPAPAQPSDPNARNDIVGKTSMTLPSFTGILPPPTMTRVPTPVQEGVPPSTPSPAQFPAPPANTPQPSGGSPGRRGGLLRSAGILGGIPATPPVTQMPFADMSPAAPLLPPFPAPAGSPADGPYSMMGIEGEQDMTRIPTGRTSALMGPANGSGEGSAAEKLDSVQQDARDMVQGTNLEQGKTGVLMGPNDGSEYGGRVKTGALMQPVEDPTGQGTTGMMKLTQSVKIVKVPVAGQPGRYVTGLLPVVSPATQVLPQLPEQAPEQTPPQHVSFQDRMKHNLKVFLVLVVVLVVLFASGIFLLVRSQNHPPAPSTANATAQSSGTDFGATATVQANATAQANIIVADPLSDNNHNWKLASNGPQLFMFENGAYHITNRAGNAASALLPDEILPSSFVYSLTLDEIKGDDTSINNQFGLIVRYSTTSKNTSTFYLFDIASAKAGGEYQFWKYDDSFGASVNPWTKLWSKPFGREYQFGHGKANTFKVAVQGTKFSFVVNNAALGSTADNALSGGQIGMLVNLKGTEVAFSNLLVTNK